MKNKTRTGAATLPTSDERPTLTVPEAGSFLGIGRAASYEAAARGDLPTIRIGRRMVVPTASLRRLLQVDDVMPGGEVWSKPR